MRTIGVSELKTRVREIVRELSEHRVQFTITYRGKPVGILSPVIEASSGETREQVLWDELSRLGDEIGRGWCSPQTSAELLSAIRR